MAGGAHGIPVHALAGPVAPVAGSALVFVSVNIEPFVFRRVQGDVAGLHAAARRGNEKLAERVVANDPDGLIGAALFVESEGEDLGEAVGIDKGFGGVLAVNKGLFGSKGFVVLLLRDETFGLAVVRGLPGFESGFVTRAAGFRSRVF